MPSLRLSFLITALVHFSGTAVAQPEITGQPTSVALYPFSNQTAIMAVSVQQIGTRQYTYQWYKDRQPIPGANRAALVVESIGPHLDGSYHVVVADAGGSTTSRTANVRYIARSALTNASVRTRLDPGAAVIMGVVTGGNAPITVGFTAIGPTLRDFGVLDALDDPILSVYRGQTALASVDNWQGIPFSPLLGAIGSKNAAATVTFAPGGVTAVISGYGGSAGVALAELYDLDPEGDAFIINAACRSFVRQGEGVLILGFHLKEKTRLGFRATGPSLRLVGVSNTIPETRLRVHRSDGTLLLTNTTWLTNQEDVRAAGISGGFVSGSELQANEAASVMELSPGAYTFTVDSQFGNTGEALAEIYEVP